MTRNTGKPQLLQVCLSQRLASVTVMSVLKTHSICIQHNNKKNIQKMHTQSKNYFQKDIHTIKTNASPFGLNNNQMEAAVMQAMHMIRLNLQIDLLTYILIYL